ncbi:unnamed protein product [Pylaiella littoralis]
MSSFHPLGSTADSHPLTASRVDLPFHDDDDDVAWTPPSLPGETRIPPAGTGRAGRTSGAGGGSSSRSPLDPLHSSGSGGGGGGGGGSFANGHGDDRAAAEEESYGRTVNKHSNIINNSRSGSSGGSSGITTNNSAAGGGRRERDRAPPTTTRAGGSIAKAAVGAESRTLSSVHSLRLHSYYAPTFCDACSQLLIGIMQQGLQCEVCRMNLHPECRATPCSHDHRCRPPESVQIPPGVDESRIMGVRLKPGYPGGNNGIGSGGGGGVAGGAPVQDPLESDWHQQLVQNNQLWVPDSVAAGCMVCSRPFNLVLRRHHCRRCGTCMCGWCSHTAVSDKVLSVNQVTGAVTRLSSTEPVRCCTPCTRVLDQQLARALQRRGWGAGHGTPASIDAVRKRFQGATSTSVPFVAAGGGGYAATLPVLMSSEATESHDGGGVAPPARVAPRGYTSPGRADGGGGFGSSGGGSYSGAGEGNGYGGSGGPADVAARGGASGIGIGDDPLARVSQQQRLSPPPPPQWREEPQPAAGEVPSWLGKSSLGSSRRAAGTATSTSRAPVPKAEQQQQQYQHQHQHQRIRQQQQESVENEAGGVWGDDAGGVWGEQSAGTEEATDWSNSGSVV